MPTHAPAPTRTAQDLALHLADHGYTVPAAVAGHPTARTAAALTEVHDAIHRLQDTLTGTRALVPGPGWHRVRQGVGTVLVQHTCKTQLVAGESAANNALLNDLMARHVCGRLTVTPA